MNALSLCCVVLSVFLCNIPSYAEDAQPWIADIKCTPSYVWCTTKDGLYQFDFTAGVVSRYTPVDYGSMYAATRHITQAPDSSLWITTYDEFILRYKDSILTKLDASAFGLSTFPIMRKIIFTNNSTWMATMFEVYRFADATWTSYTNNQWAASSNTPVSDFAIDREGTVWSVGFFGLARVDTENGNTVEDQRFRGRGNRIVIDADGVFWIGTGSNGLLVIDGDSVTSYTTENSGIPSNTVYDLAFDSSGLLWLGGVSYVATFDGFTWTVYDENDFWALYRITSIAFDSEGTKWFGTYGNGLLRFDGESWTQYNLETGDIITAVEDTKVPAAIELLPAYPNPFNPQTTISYTLPVLSEVTLSVYSVTGQQVAVLVDSYQRAGTHTAVFDGESLASGVYVARLETDEAVQTKKMLLVK